MTKRDWYINLATVIGLWAVDFFTKMMARKVIRGFPFFGPVGFILHYNPGAMLGAFSSLPPVLRIVSLSTGGAFLCFIFLALQYLIPIPTARLRIGMSILLGGILGNVTDRIVSGAVTDFIVFGSTAHTTPAFNIADAVQWVGYVLIVYSLVKDGHLFWPEHNIRRKVWINPSFQMKFILLLLAMGFGFVLISGVFFYTYLKVSIDSLVVGVVPETENRYLNPFFITFGVISIGFMLLLLLIGRVVSHRTAGPLYAFEKFLDDILGGRDREFQLRDGDDFKHLEELAQKIRATFISIGLVKRDNPAELPRGEVVTPIPKRNSS
jgi:signal peptidase II